MRSLIPMLFQLLSWHILPLVIPTLVPKKTGNIPLIKLVRWSLTGLNRVFSGPICMADIATVIIERITQQCQLPLKLLANSAGEIILSEKLSVGGVPRLTLANWR